MAKKSNRPTAKDIKAILDFKKSLVDVGDALTALDPRHPLSFWLPSIGAMADDAALRMREAHKPNNR